MSQHYRDGGRFGDMKGMYGILDDQLPRRYKYEVRGEHMKEQVPQRLDAYIPSSFSTEENL